MVLAGNKAKRLLSVNHITKTIHHHHNHTNVRIVGEDFAEGVLKVVFLRFCVSNDQ